MSKSGMFLDAFGIDFLLVFIDFLFDFESPETLKIELSLQRRAHFQEIACLLTWSTLHRFWDRFFIDFWRILVPKSIEKSIQKSIEQSMAFGIDLLWIFGPFRKPKTSPDRI